MTDGPIFDEVKNDLSLIHEKLKELIRIPGFTYNDIGNAIGKQETTVANNFSDHDLDTREITKILRLIDMRADQFYEMVYEDKSSETMLTEEQENQIISDPELLLWIICMTNAMSEEDIQKKYPYFDVRKSSRILRQLDEYGIINRTAAKNNQARIKPYFEWRNNGPIQNYFLDHAAAEYFETSKFDDSHEKVISLSCFTSEVWNTYAQKKLVELASDLNYTAKALSKKLPQDKKKFMTVVLAIRPFEFSVFDKYRASHDDDT